MFQLTILTASESLIWSGVVVNDPVSSSFIRSIGVDPLKHEGSMFGSLAGLRRISPEPIENGCEIERYDDTTVNAQRSLPVERDQKLSRGLVFGNAHSGPAFAEGILCALGQCECEIGRGLPRGVPTL